nr:MAG TPA: hypothetical protein [Caudoviricetes sp.]
MSSLFGLRYISIRWIFERDTDCGSRPFFVGRIRDG